MPQDLVLELGNEPGAAIELARQVEGDLAHLDVPERPPSRSAHWLTLRMVQVILRPAQGTQFAPVGPEHDRQAQEQAELRLLDCGGRQQPGDVLDRRRLGVDSGR
jgi:hypothetical protein